MADTLYSDLLSHLFVSVLLLALAAGFWVSFLSSHKPYQKIVVVALVVEASRIFPDYFLIGDPDNFYALTVTLALQFAGTTLLLYALLLANGRTIKRRRITTASLTGIFLASNIYLFLIGSDIALFSVEAYISSIGIIMATILVIGEGWKAATSISASRILFSLAALSLLMIRTMLPSMEADDIYSIVYYLELLAYPIIVIGLMLAEVENTNKRINDLLADKARSEADLKFIVNNTLDIILVSNEVGLLQSWSQKAQEKFGYSENQAIGKIHMDELFVGNHIDQSGEETAEFQNKMESMDGSNFMADIRLQTVVHNKKIYSIYVLRDMSSTKASGYAKALLEPDKLEDSVELEDSEQAEVNE
jgi:PAS domain S-box-containing protein